MSAVIGLGKARLGMARFGMAGPGSAGQGEATKQRSLSPLSGGSDEPPLMSVSIWHGRAGLGLVGSGRARQGNETEEFISSVWRK